MFIEFVNLYNSELISIRKSEIVKVVVRKIKSIKGHKIIYNIIIYIKGDKLPYLFASVDDGIEAGRQHYHLLKKINNDYK